MAQKVGRREKLAQKVGKRVIYSPVPPPSQRVKTFLLFWDYSFLLECYLVGKLRCKWTDMSAIEVNAENERIIVMCSRCL